MILTPRPYQVDAVHSVFDYFSSGNKGNPLLALPTGTGKSVIIAMLLQAIYSYWPNQRVLILTHVKELIQQNYEKLLTLWPGAPAGVYSAGLNRYESNRKVTFAGIASVAKKARLFGWVDIVLIDECHLVSPSADTMYKKFLNDLKFTNPALKVIGYTATPWRLGLGHLTEGDIFTDVCYDLTDLKGFNQLIADGYLSPLIPKKTSMLLDIEGVNIVGGEFNQSQLQLVVDRNEVTSEALQETYALAADRKQWLIFSSGIDHSDHIAEQLNKARIPSVSIHSKMGNSERDKAIAGFKAGKYRAAVNNNVLTTGFDHPAIDCIVVLRPTASPVLWVQMLGRGTRPHGGKDNCLVLDFAGNTRRLGPINDPVIPKKKGKKKGDAPVKLCGSCSTYNHASATHCICCGAEFSFAVKIKQTASSDELIKTDLPEVEVFKVDDVSYVRSDREGRPPLMKVTYYCGLRAFSDYVCIEHNGFPQRKARAWWKTRTELPFPETVNDALNHTNELKVSTHLRVWVNKKHPEILGHSFDGTEYYS